MLALTLSLNGVQMVMGQATPPTTPPNPGGVSAAPVTPAPAPTTPAQLTPAQGTTPAAVPGTPGAVVTPGTTATPGVATTPARTLTLADVVNLAVNNNSTVSLARLRLQKAQYQIDTINAEARPQVSASVVDTLNSQRGFSTGAVNVSNPTVPGGGQIPVITDQGGGTTGTFVGGGGGGTAPSTGAISTTTGGGTAPSTGSVSGAGTSTGVGTGTGTTGTGTTGTGTGAGGGVGTGGSGAVGTQAIALQELPPIAQQFARTTQQIPPRGAAEPRAVGRAGGTGTGTPGGGGAGSGTANTTTGTTFSTGSSGQYNNYSGRVSVTQFIDVFGLVPAARDVEKITRDFYAIDLDRIMNETALSAKNEFFTVLRDQAQIAVDQEQVTAAAANLRYTQVRYTAGVVPESDVLTAEVTLSNDQQTLVADQSALNLAAANLNNLLGLPPSTPLRLQQPALPPTAAIDLPRSTQIALQQRPEIRQADNNIVIARRLIRLAGANLLPSFGIAAGANYSGNTAPGSPHDDYTLTAQVSVPLYDGGYTRAQVHSAQVDLQTQLTTRDQLRQNVTLEVQQAYDNIINDQARVASAAVGVVNAREAARIAALQYQYGTNTFLNVLNAQAQLATAETDQLNAAFGYQSDLATLVRAIGGR